MANGIKIAKISVQICKKHEQEGLGVGRKGMAAFTSVLEQDDPECKPLRVYTLGRFALVRDGTPLRYARKARSKRGRR